MMPMPGGSPCRPRRRAQSRQASPAWTTPTADSEAVRTPQAQPSARLPAPPQVGNRAKPARLAGLLAVSSRPEGASRGRSLVRPPTSSARPTLLRFLQPPSPIVSLGGLRPFVSYASSRSLTASHFLRTCSLRPAPAANATRLARSASAAPLRLDLVKPSSAAGELNIASADRPSWSKQQR